MVKFIVPNMDESFGRLDFFAKAKDTRGYVNKQERILRRNYVLLSEKQKADEIVVSISSRVPDVDLEKFDRVRLVNPVITAVSRQTDAFTYTDYVLTADAIEPYDEVKK